MCVDIDQPDGDIGQLESYAHYERAPERFYIDNIRGACVYELDEETGEMSIRKAEVLGGHATGIVYYPKLIEKGWVPAYRVDHLPDVDALKGMEYFATYPVGKTGHDSDTDYTLHSVSEFRCWYYKWLRWRSKADPKTISPEQNGVSRLARNASRPVPLTQDYVWYTAQEIFDMIEHDYTEVIADGYHVIVFNLDRNLVARYQLGSDANDGYPVWGLNTTYPDDMERIANKLNPHEFNEFLTMGVDEDTLKPCLLVELRKTTDRGELLRKMINITSKFFQKGCPWIEPNDEWPSDSWWYREGNYPICNGEK